MITINKNRTVSISVTSQSSSPQTYERQLTESDHPYFWYPEEGNYVALRPMTRIKTRLYWQDVRGAPWTYDYGAICRMETGNPGEIGAGTVAKDGGEYNTSNLARALLDNGASTTLSVNSAGVTTDVNGMCKTDTFYTDDFSDPTHIPNGFRLISKRSSGEEWDESQDRYFGAQIYIVPKEIELPERYH